MDFIAFGEKMQVPVRFIEKMDFSTADLEFSSLTDLKNRLIKQGVIKPAGFRINNSVSEYHFLTSGGGKIGFITPISRHFCATCSKIRLKANGEIKLCVFADDNYNLRNILRSEADDETVKNWLTDIIQFKPFEPVRRRNLETMAEIGG